MTEEALSVIMNQFPVLSHEPPALLLLIFLFL